MATYDFLLVAHNNHASTYISHRFLYTAISVENRKYFSSRVTNVPLIEFSSEFRNDGSAQKTRIMSLPDGRKTLTICATF